MSPCLRGILVLVFAVASGLKQADWLLGVGTTSDLLLGELEFAICIFVLADIYSRIVRCVLICVFAAFLCKLGADVLDNNPSCGCLGSMVEVPPMWMIGLDSVLLIMLTFWPRVGSPYQSSKTIWRNCKTMIFFVAAVFLSSLSVSDAGDEVDVPGAMRAVDDRYSDVLIEYKKREFQTIVPLKLILREKRFVQSFKVKGLEVPSKLPKPDSPDLPSYVPASVETILECHGRILLKDGIVAIEQGKSIRLIPGAEQKLVTFISQLAGAPAAQRWSNSDQMVRNLTSSETLFIDHTPAALQIMDEQRLAIEFALGFGFGKRLVSVLSVEPTGADGGHRIKGTLALWRGDESDCELTLDSNFLVRKAEIVFVSPGQRILYETSAISHWDSTSESILPATGTFEKRRFLLTGSEERIEPMERFELTIIGVERPIDSDEYGTLTTFPVSSKTIVRDFAAELREEADLAAMRSVERNQLGLLLVLMNFAILSAIIIWRYLKWTKRSVNPKG